MIPSLAPTDVPSSGPSESPTDVPTIIPSIAPTDIPSSRPSVQEPIVNTDFDAAFTVPSGWEFSVSPLVDVPESCDQTRGLDVEICIVADASGSFSNDLINIRRAGDEIYQGVNELFNHARFGVTAFVDYPSSLHPDDYPYRVFTQMTDDLSTFETAIMNIEQGHGGDPPESQYDGIVGAIQGKESDGPDCGWLDDQTFERILIAWTDASFHIPGEGTPYVYDQDSTLAILQKERIRLIGLRTAVAGDELDFLAESTGGTVREVNYDGSDIIEEILGALEDDFSCRVMIEAVGCDPLTLNPSSPVVEPGSTSLVEISFSTAGVAPGTEIQCQAVIYINRVVVETIDIAVMVTESE